MATMTLTSSDYTTAWGARLKKVELLNIEGVVEILGGDKLYNLEDTQYSFVTYSNYFGFDTSRSLIYLGIPRENVAGRFTYINLGKDYELFLNSLSILSVCYNVEVILNGETVTGAISIGDIKK